MMSISSPAGRRLAVAFDELSKAKAKLRDTKGDNPARRALLVEMYGKKQEFIWASAAVGKELIAQRFHEMEGD